MLGIALVKSTLLLLRSWLSIGQRFGSVSRALTPLMASLWKTFVSFGKHAIGRKWHVTAAELAGAGAVWRGIADWSFPASLIVAGLAVIAVIEIRRYLTGKQT